MKMPLKRKINLDPCYYKQWSLKIYISHPKEYIQIGLCLGHIEVCLTLNQQRYSHGTEKHDTEPVGKARPSWTGRWRQDSQGHLEWEQTPTSATELCSTSSTDSEWDLAAQTQHLSPVPALFRISLGLQLPAWRNTSLPKVLSHTCQPMQRGLADPRVSLTAQSIQIQANEFHPRYLLILM